MTPMDRYNKLKSIRDMHKNMALVAVTADVRDIHARHAREFQGMIDELRADVGATFHPTHWQPLPAPPSDATP